MAPKVPISDTGTATTGISVARSIAQEDEHDQDHQDDGDHQRLLDFRSEARMVVVRSTAQRTSMAGEIEARSSGSKRLHPVDRLDDVGAGLRGRG